jgi:hypothetical protein
MSAHLDELYRQYCAMLRDGLAPSGLVMEYELLKRIADAARRDDPRVEWGRGGPERLFGFRPQFVLSAPPRFTFPHGVAEKHSSGRNFTLRELRAL